MQSVYSYVVLVLVGLGVFFFQKNIITKERLTIASLEAALAKKDAHAMMLELQSSECKSAIASQNESLHAIEADRNKKMQELRALQSKPPDVRYEVIYKTIPTIEVKSDECKDIKTLLDAIRSAGL